MKPDLFFMAVQPGLENITKIELLNANVNNFTQYHGGFEFYGHNSLYYRLNNTIRTASRILIRFAKFHAASFWELEQKAKKLPWEKFYCGQKLVFRINTRSSKLYHKKGIEERLIKSIQFRTREYMNAESPFSLLVVVNIQNDTAEISIDTSGEHLHKRGYADWRTVAPLRETIAGAMIISCLKKGTIEKVIDPMCGSGTIILEAACIFSNLPFFLFRGFSFEQFPCFQSRLYHEIKELLYKSSKPCQIPILGMDISDKAVRTAKHNASNLNISYIEILHGDCASLGVKVLQNTTVISNPPYGNRIDNRGTPLVIKKLVEYRKKNIIKNLCLLIPDNKGITNAEKIFSTKNGNIRVSYSLI